MVKIATVDYPRRSHAQILLIDGKMMDDKNGVQFSNFDKIALFTCRTTYDKLRDIGVGSENTSIKRKKGLFDDKVEIVKKYFDYLDAYDWKLYNKVLEHIQNNENNVQNQLYMQNTLSTKIIKKLNDKVRDMLRKEDLLRTSIFDTKSKMNEI